MDEKNKKIIDKFNLKEVIILIIVTALASLLTGFAITNRMLKDKYQEDGVSTSSTMNTFIKNYNYIISNYYGEVDENKLLDAALEGVLEALDDPYTTYIDKTEVDNFNIQLEGSYQGLGIEIYNDNDNRLTVLTVFAESPAANAGLKPGDVFLKIDGEDVTGLTSQEFSNRIKNRNNAKFVLTIKRGEEELELEVETSQVTLTSAISRIIESDNQNIGYLGISIFANNTYLQVKEELKKLESEGIDSLIIDVRSNTGGHLTSVENILGLFLDSSHIVYKTQNSDKIDTVYSTGKTTKLYPIVVLTNEMSASASEILTATLKEEYGAKSVGKKTYGKGSAQELRTLPDGTQYKFTTKKWLTPKGNSIDGVGVDVDLEIEFDSDYYNNPTDENDTQLQAAIKMIKE